MKKFALVKLIALVAIVAGVSNISFAKTEQKSDKNFRFICIGTICSTEPGNECDVNNDCIK